MGRETKAGSSLISLGVYEKTEEVGQPFPIHEHLAIRFVINPGTLRDNGGNPIIFGGNNQSVPTGSGGAPQHDVLGIDLWSRSRILNRCTHILELA
jgi:hypothetical protein